MTEISVIIPVFNASSFLKKCFDCIESQSFSNFEVVFVNDGSKDNSLEQINSYKKKSSKIIKIVSQDNCGASAARNAGVRISEGRYISFFDVDDEISPDFLKILYENIKKNDADISVCNYLSGVTRDSWILSSDSFSSENVFEDFVNKKIDFGMCVFNKLYRKELVEKLSFDLSLKVGEDLLFLYQIFYLAQKVTYTTSSLYWYKTNANSLMHSSFSKKIIESNINCSVLLFEFLKDKDIDHRIKDKLYRRISKRIFNYCVVEPVKEDKKNFIFWFDYTYQLLINLKNKGIYSNRYLSLKNKLIEFLFVKKKFLLLKSLMVVVK